MSIIFFDNDEEHVEDMRALPNCTAIHVPDTEPNSRMGPLQDPYDSDEYTARYYALFPGNTFLQEVRRAQGENYLPTLGITEEIIGQLNAWIDATPGKKIAIFDWDRTLTVVEGITLPLDSHWQWYKFDYYHLIPEDILLFLLGGPERLQMIRDMFTDLYSKGIDVFVNTRNPSCLMNRQAFLVLLQLLTGGRFQPANLICASGIPKSFAQSRSQSFQNVLSRGGRWTRGSRRTRRNRIKKHKGTTHYKKRH